MFAEKYRPQFHKFLQITLFVRRAKHPLPGILKIRTLVIAKRRKILQFAFAGKQPQTMEQDKPVPEARMFHSFSARRDERPRCIKNIGQRAFICHKTKKELNALFQCHKLHKVWSSDSWESSDSFVLG